MKFKNCILIFGLFIFANCTRLPLEKLSQVNETIVDYNVADDSLKIELSNPLDCPLRITANSSDEAIDEKLKHDFPITMDPHENTSISYWTNEKEDDIPLKFSARLGNPNDSITKEKVNLPFQKGKKYKVLQGYNGSFSHSSDYSKYALDFNLQVGDTICAAADGFVVGVIEGYSKGGRSKKWRDYANYITIFHPKMNLYTQYVHLMHLGSFVEVGDYVIADQVIGRSGETGLTGGPHLHFNVLRPNDTGMQSETIDFSEDYKGVDLKKGDWVKK